MDGAVVILALLNLSVSPGIGLGCELENSKVTKSADDTKLFRMVVTKANCEEI